MLGQQEKHVKKRNAEHPIRPVVTILAAGKIGLWRLECPVVDCTSCIKCGTCEWHCPSDIIIIDRGAEERVRIDFDYCKGCGVCVDECPKDCIAMVGRGGGENV